MSNTTRVAAYLLVMGTAFPGSSHAGAVYEQLPEFAPTIHEAGTPTGPAVDFTAGPNPQWIWGAENDRAYVLRTTFAGPATAARLRFSTDNAGDAYLNGVKVGGGDDWNQAVEVDVSKHLKAGENELWLEVRNAGGVAAAVAKLVLTRPDGKHDYVVTGEAWTAAETRDGPAVKVSLRGKHGDGPWGAVLHASESSSRGLFEVPAGFRVERLYTVPKDQLGSWVCLTTDDRGRLLVSDQGDKGLCRITPSPLGSTEPTKVEQLDVKISAAQGMLYAFGSLYLSVNGGPGSGLYRVRDTNSDDQFDEVTKLRDFRGGGEHGPHALVLSPDGQSIYVACGNHTLPPFNPGDEQTDPLFSSRIPTNWGEDHLLPRQWDANGHARGVLAPGGWVAKTDPNGESWELVSIGYRNQYDMAFNGDGELFVYDADMEWDMGSPWYRPTRVNHATSGSELGWRSGTGKWPSYYQDSLPEAVNIGPGSPVGVAFGYGTKFPEKYQRALYICDWTFGTMYAIHLTPEGATYRGQKDEFVARTPLPLTDVTVGQDGALYFTVGGRGTQSELFRVTYTGTESTAAVDLKTTAAAELRALRRGLEAYHQPLHEPDQAIEQALPQLGHSDRFIRYAARIALEHQPANLWQDRALAATDPHALITAVIGLARQGTTETQPKLLAALERLSWERLSEEQRLGMLRAYQLVFTRTGPPTEVDRERLAAAFDPRFPSQVSSIDRELINLLVYLQSPTIAAKGGALLDGPDVANLNGFGGLLDRNQGYGGSIASMLANQPDQQKIHYAFALRNLKTGWTPDLRKAYFGFLTRAADWSGGASFRGFLRNIDRDAFENATEAERLQIEALGARQPYKAPELPKPVGPGQDWTLDAVRAAAESGLMSGRNFKNGEKMFAAARCVLCHRFAGDGGATGPDLTQLAGRFNPKDLTEAILDPNKVISDQYRASIVVTTAGKSYTGKIVSETAEMILIVTNPEDSTAVAEVRKSDIEELTPSPVSLMPKDLLKSLNEAEVLDLLAYLLSRGNPGDAMFRK
jgi:putative heme-binding domain-containing protein